MDHYKILAEDVRIRILATLKEKGISQNQVAAGDSAAQKRINSQLNHGSNITLDTILRILVTCPDISADWLLRGSQNSPTTKKFLENGNQQNGTLLTENFVRELIAEKDKQIFLLIEKLKK